MSSEQHPSYVVSYRFLRRSVGVIGMLSSGRTRPGRCHYLFRGRASGNRSALTITAECGML